MIRADAPAGLYAFFTETLQLPIAWPLAMRGSVTSGAVGFGNVNVEVIKFPDQRSSLVHLVGFGFEPAPLASECLIELHRRDIPYGTPRPFIITERDGSKRTLFTNVTLRQFSDDDRPANATMHIFLSEYSPTYVNVEQRRARLLKELRATGGGPLGVTGVAEVIVGATDVKLAMNMWERLLAPRRAVEPGFWRVGDGLRVQLPFMQNATPLQYAIDRAGRTFPASLSLIAAESGHWILFDQPDLVVRAVRALVDAGPARLG